MKREEADAVSIETLAALRGLQTRGEERLDAQRIAALIDPRGRPKGFQAIAHATLEKPTMDAIFTDAPSFDARQEIVEAMGQALDHAEVRTVGETTRILMAGAQGSLAAENRTTGPARTDPLRADLHDFVGQPGRGQKGLEIEPSQSFRGGATDGREPVGSGGREAASTGAGQSKSGQSSRIRPASSERFDPDALASPAPRARPGSRDERLTSIAGNAAKRDAILGPAGGSGRKDPPAPGRAGPGPRRPMDRSR